METNAEGPRGDAELIELWGSLVEILAPAQRVWLQASKPVMLAENTAVIAVPNEFTRSQLEGRMRTRLEDGLSERLGRPVRIAVTVDETLETDAPRPTDQPHAGEHGPTGRSGYDAGQAGDGAGSPTAGGPGPYAGGAERSGGDVGFGTPDRRVSPDRGAPSLRQQSDLSTNGLTASLTTGIPDSPLNPRYTFETFVIGSSNRFAHAAAVAVAEAPGKAYNPLLVYGDSGLGKTHLLHAIGHYVRSLYTGAKIRYVSSEAFTNDVINAIKDANTAALQRRYRDVDVLLVDDI